VHSNPKQQETLNGNAGEKPLKSALKT
jgi:hypothetical protein